MIAKGQKKSRQVRAERVASKPPDAVGVVDAAPATGTRPEQSVEVSATSGDARRRVQPAEADVAPSNSGSGSSPGQTRPQAGPTEILGQVAWLMMQSPAHKHLFVTDLEWLVLPPLMLKQFRIFRQKNVPVAYACWAFLSEDAEARLTNGAQRLKPEDWRSGDRLLLVDLIAPFGGGNKFVEEIAQRVFPGKDLNMLQVDISGQNTHTQTVNRTQKSSTHLDVLKETR